jgi:hypothetical protein
VPSQAVGPADRALHTPALSYRGARLSSQVVARRTVRRASHGTGAWSHRSLAPRVYRVKPAGGLASRLRCFCSSGPVQNANAPSCQTPTSGTGVRTPVRADSVEPLGAGHHPAAAAATLPGADRHQNHR